MDIGPIAGFFAGWVACAFSVVLVRLGQLELPGFPTNLWTVLLSGLLGFLVGISYLGIAKVVNGNKAMTSLFVLGSVGGSLISLFFFVVYQQVQVIFISSAVAFLFGVLVYVMLFEGRGHPGGIQGAYRDFVATARRGK